MNLQADAEALGLQVMHIRIMPVCASTVVFTHAHMLKRQPCAVNKISAAPPRPMAAVADQAGSCQARRSDGEGVLLPCLTGSLLATGDPYG